MLEKRRDFHQRTDEELLELLLRSTDRAKQILAQMPISDLDQAHRNELGLTPKAYERLQASIELGRRIQESKASFNSVVKISSSSDAIQFCRQHFARLISDCLQEEFHIVTLELWMHRLYILEKCLAAQSRTLHRLSFSRTTIHLEIRLRAGRILL
jgi:DNA repair protein RadC